jgi:hypothetical protein
MTKPTRRKLLWIGATLILLPTAVVIFFILSPAPEYQSSIFIEVHGPGEVIPPAPIDHTILYAILALIGVYLPGVALTLTALLIRPSLPSSAGGSPRI